MPREEVEHRRRVALVTGASRGIGRAIGLRLATGGLAVAVGYHRERAAAEAVCDEIRRAGGRAVAVGGDLARVDTAGAMVRRVEQELGPVDVLVSNAGAAVTATLPELDVAEWDRTMNAHLRAAFLLSQRVAPGMQQRCWGRIVVISSVAAFSGGIVGPHYTAAKAGQLGLVRSLSGALAPHGVTVNAVAPALVETGMLAQLAGDRRERLAERIPVGRFGHPAEVAEVVWTVVENGYLTGQTISVDGGLHPR
ncbi:MAG TPA: SDR family NAD(P)-dependent oxidoreductase [Gammaproteobacteria bacterium]|nr:SDR family NAD(P)-dependent oxidoreductase [Gammaproteobacteria bacterium]